MSPEKNKTKYDEVLELAKSNPDKKVYWAQYESIDGKNFKKIYFHTTYLGDGFVSIPIKLNGKYAPSGELFVPRKGGDGIEL